MLYRSLPAAQHNRLTNYSTDIPEACCCVLGNSVFGHPPRQTTQAVPCGSHVVVLVPPAAPLPCPKWCAAQPSAVADHAAYWTIAAGVAHGVCFTWLHHLLASRMLLPHLLTLRDTQPGLRGGEIYYSARCLAFVPCHQLAVAVLCYMSFVSHVRILE
jgi:hypothetical protein